MYSFKHIRINIYMLLCAYLVDVILMYIIFNDFNGTVSKCVFTTQFL